MTESSGNTAVDNTIEEIVESVMPVVISTQPESMVVTEGTAVLFAVNATGGGQLYSCS
ncbi:MAG: hypothetical protein ACI9T7_001556 [Oleiphilaceae bacterium]